MKEEKTLILWNEIRAVPEEIAGRKRFWVSGEDLWPPTYQLEALEHGICSGILPMCFAESSGKKKIYYDHDGFIQLSNALRTESLFEIQKSAAATEVLLRILAETTACVLEIEDRLLLSDICAYSIDTIFIHADTGEVRLAYVPYADEKTDEQTMMIDLLKSMQHFCGDDQWQSYAADILKELSAGNKGYAELIKYFTVKSRDSCMRGWPSQVMDREDIKDDVDIGPAVMQKKRFLFSF
jgi:hypothetical protein